MKLRFSTTLLAVVATLSTASLAGAQSRGAQVNLGFGAVLYDGAANESGIGLAGRIQYETRLTDGLRFGIEVGAQTLSALAQSCTLGIPSGCSPETPVSPVWHLRAQVSRDVFRPLYLTAGVGLYGPVGAADRPRDLAAGVDVGVGIGVSGRAALETSYRNLRAERHLAHSLQLGLKVRL